MKSKIATLKRNFISQKIWTLLINKVLLRQNLLAANAVRKPSTRGASCITYGDATTVMLPKLCYTFLSSIAELLFVIYLRTVVLTRVLL